MTCGCSCSIRRGRGSGRRLPVPVPLDWPFRTYRREEPKRVSTAYPSVHRYYARSRNSNAAHKDKKTTRKVHMRAQAVTEPYAS